MKYFLSVCLLVMSAAAQAGHLRPIQIGCGACGNKLFMLEWGGPWLTPLLVLDYSPSWSGSWLFYAGYLPPQGFDSSPVYNAQYLMKSCQGQNCTPEAMSYVPYFPCGPIR